MVIQSEKRGMFPDTGTRAKYVSSGLPYIACVGCCVPRVHERSAVSLVRSSTMYRGMRVLLYVRVFPIIHSLLLVFVSNLVFRVLRFLHSSEWVLSRLVT